LKIKPTKHLQHVKVKESYILKVENPNLYPKIDSKKESWNTLGVVFGCGFFTSSLIAI